MILALPPRSSTCLCARPVSAATEAWHDEGALLARVAVLDVLPDVVASDGEGDDVLARDEQVEEGPALAQCPYETAVDTRT
jgi:hypothetical protein